MYILKLCHTIYMICYSLFLCVRHTLPISESIYDCVIHERIKKKSEFVKTWSSSRSCFQREQSLYIVPLREVANKEKIAATIWIKLENTYMTKSLSNRGSIWIKVSIGSRYSEENNQWNIDVNYGLRRLKKQVTNERCADESTNLVISLNYF